MSYISTHKYLSPALLLIAVVAFGGAAFGAPHEKAAPANPALWPLYQQIGIDFWDTENQLQSRVDPFANESSPYKSPLAKTDPLYQKYFQVDQSVGKYVAALDQQKKQSWTLPPVLYFGGIAAFTIGDYANAQKYFSRLLKDYPDYERNAYINDRDAPDPDFAQPVKPGVSKLLFFAQLQSLTNHASDGMGAFQQFNQTSLKVLFTQTSFANWLANRPHKSQRRNFFNEDYGDEEPDQSRASVLPLTAKLIDAGWQQLFPVALKKSGALKMRTYLRTLTADDSSLHDIASPRLAEVDQLVIKSYFAQAKVLLAKHNFAATRKKYKQIIAEYSDSDAAKRAETALPKVVPVAVNYYKKEGDKNWNPVGHMGVPQDKAMKFYESMYKEDPDGPKADYALFYWARGLGSVGKVKEEIQLLEQNLDKFPKSKIRSAVLYELGFAYGGLPIGNHQKGIEIFAEVAKQFPRSEQAPEALWHEAFLYAVDEYFDKAIPLLQQLKAQYPKSKRTQWVDAWVDKYQKVLKGDAQWP